MELMEFENRIPTQEGTYLGKPERKKFLVVEDDFAAQPIWDKIIRSVDPKAIIRWATTEEGAEKLIQERADAGDRFDFVIADIFLDGPKTGIDLWKRFGGGSTQFLFISSITRNKFHEMLGQWKNQYPLLIRKPFNLNECVESLISLLKAQKYFNLGLGQ
jgi:response regulator of citrate/malate metabolism